MVQFSKFQISAYLVKISIEKYIISLEFLSKLFLLKLLQFLRISESGNFS